MFGLDHRAKGVDGVIRRIHVPRGRLDLLQLPDFLPILFSGSLS